MDAGDFRVSTYALDGTNYVVVEGEIDLLTAPLLADAIEARADGHALCVDLSAVRFIDASGLRVFARTDAQRRAEGATLEFVGVTGIVRRVFMIGGLGSLLGADDQ